MKILQLILLLITPFVCFAQQPFTINGNVKNLTTRDKVYLIYGPNLIDSAQVTDGKFSFKGSIIGTREAKLIKNVHPNFPKDESHPAPDFVKLYVEAGNINLASDNGLKNSIVKGTSTNEEMLDLIEAEKPIKEKLLAHSKRRALLDNDKDKELVDQSKKERIYQKSSSQ